MLSASRLLRNVNLRRDVLIGARSLSLSLHENRSLSNPKRISPWKRTPKKFQNAIEFLETNTRRYGRIDPNIFKQCLDTLPKENITSKESLILLKCCGPLMFNLTKDNRNKFANQIWDLIKEKRIPIDIMHYNLLIKTYTENEYDFDPLKILDEIKKENLEPNLRTYEFIINKYCQDGNLDKVTKVLEQMNEKNLSLTAPMFDSLILGHFKNKDTTTALETFELMKENNIEITNSTYKNLIIGYLHNHDSTTFESIKELINSNQIHFDITEVTNIIEHLNKLNEFKDNKSVSEFKELLINNLDQNENFYNDISNSCYILILNREYDMVRKLFNKYFNDEQTADYFIKRLMTSILKSDEKNIKDYVKFLKDIYPSFQFFRFAKTTLIASNYSLNQILDYYNQMKSVLSDSDYSLFGLLIDRCESNNDLHLITERYLENLSPSWINHIKKNFLPFIQVDLFKFMQEHSIRNPNTNSLHLLKVSIFCYLFDKQDIKQLNEFYDTFTPAISQLLTTYLTERTESAIKLNSNNYLPLFNCLLEKIANNANFSAKFLGICSDHLDENQLKNLIDLYKKNNIQINKNDLNKKQLDKLLSLNLKQSEMTIRSEIMALRQKIANGIKINIDEDLKYLKSKLTSGEQYTIFRECVEKDYELASFFYDKRFKLYLPTVFKFLHLKLQNNEDKNEALAFLDSHFNDFQDAFIADKNLEKIMSQIFDKIADEEALVFRFTNRISSLLPPERLFNHLIHFFEKTNSNEIGMQLIKLDIHLIKKDVNLVFKTLIAFINRHNTELLQEFSHRITDPNQKDLYTKSRFYEELAIAFVYTNRYKQAIKVIQTNDFRVNKIQPVLNYLISTNRQDVIKKYSVLVYQYSPKSRQILLEFLDKFTNKFGNQYLFKEILLEIKKQQIASDDQPLIEKFKRIEDKSKILDAKEDVLKLTDQILNRQKVLKLNVECDLVDKLISLKELEKATNLVYDMLKGERYPIPATIKNLLKELNLNGRLDLIEQLEPFIPVPLKESEFYKSNKIVTYLRKTNSKDEILNCLKNINMFTADLIDQIFTIKSDYEKEIIELLKEKKKSNLHYVWIHYMQNSKFDKALELVNSNEELAEDRLLYQPLINIARQKNNLELGAQLIEYVNRFQLKSSTVENIYNCYLKLCLKNDKIEEAKKTIKQIESKEMRNNLVNLEENLLKKLDQQFIDDFIVGEK